MPKNAWKQHIKMTRFENYASFVVMVKNLRFMVQKTSILSKDFNEDIFGQKFLQFTHKWKLLYLTWISQKSKNVKISEIIYGMSSYWDEFLHLKMGSLGVLDVFCTVFECATTSRSKFKLLSIFAIFDFLIFGFWPFDHRNVDDFSFVGTKIFVSKSMGIFGNPPPIWLRKSVWATFYCG